MKAVAYFLLIVDNLKNLIIILATGYVVFGLNRSGWWFLLAVLFVLLTGFRVETTKIKNHEQEDRTQTV